MHSLSSSLLPLWLLTLVSLPLGLIYPSGTAHALAPGDIAFVGFHTDANDAFTWIALTDIAAGEEIFFSEQGWNNAIGWYTNTEGHMRYTVGAAGIPCGTLVHMEETAEQTFTVTLLPPGGSSTTEMAMGSFTWSLFNGDQVFAYQSPDGSMRPAAPVFLAGVHGDYDDMDYDPTTTWNVGLVPDTENSALPDMLTNGVNAISLFPAPGPELDNSRYTGTLTGTPDAVRMAIHNPANWTGDAGPIDIGVTAFTPPALMCPVVPVCGNGMLEAGEDCDAGMMNGATPCGCQPGCVFGASGTSCGDGADTECTDPDTCNGLGACLDNHEADGFECREAVDVCDVAETCRAGVCPMDRFAMAGTSCGDSTDTDCTDPDSCDGSGSCIDNHAADGSACSGGVFCTSGDQCAGGSCTEGATPTCNANETCVEASQACVPACGDGMLDMSMGEECDDGGSNSDSVPDACRTNCMSAACGDGVVDSGEDCDTSGATATCSATCETIVVTVDAGVPDSGMGMPDSGMGMPDGGMMTGDGGVDGDASVDDAGVEDDAGAEPDGGVDPDSGMPTRDAGVDAGGSTLAGGSSCSVGSPQDGSPWAGLFFALVAAALLRRRQR